MGSKFTACMVGGELVSVSQQTKKTAITLLSVGIAVGLFALGYFTDPLVLAIVSLFMPMAFIFIRARQKTWETILALAIFGLLIYLISDYRYAVILLAFTTPMALIGGYAIARKTTFYFSVLASCASVFVSIVLLLLSVRLLLGVTLDVWLLNYVESQLTKNSELTKLYYYMLGVMQSGSVPDVESLDLTTIFAVPAEKAVAGVMRSVQTALPVLLLQLATSVTALFGLLNYIIPRAMLKNTKTEVGEVPKFSAWNLPNRFGTWSLILLVVSLIGSLANWNNFDLVYAIVMGFLQVTYTIQGMAFVSWLLKKKIEARGTRVAIIIITYVLLSLFGLSTLYMWIGFFEQVAKFRRREQLMKK